MIQVTIDNPIINSPFEEPRAHFEFSKDGVTNKIIPGRRQSIYFTAIPAPKKQSTQQISFISEEIQENALINQLRRAVAAWRLGQYRYVTKTTRTLLDYWVNPKREKRLFFCQIEALETAIYLTEVARHESEGRRILKELDLANQEMNPELYRIAFKMATGSGKTVVMAMLIAWQALNKFVDRRNSRFSDTFLLVAPGITIRDRLQVLQPNHPNNYYKQRDILPPDLIARLGQAKIEIINFHAMLLKEDTAAAKLTKDILAQGKEVSPFKETPEQMVSRVCRDFGSKRGIVVINDEAHHCYRPRQSEEAPEKLTGEERTEAQKRDEEARVWLSGLEAIQRKLGINRVYDLSATPFYLKGSGYPEGKIFPWVVTDFSLIDAIESGIVKVPRVPVLDNTMSNDDLPTYRNLWVQIREDLPRKGRSQTKVGGGPPKLPAKLEGALQSLYTHYEKVYEQWEQNSEAQAAGQTPPVFIVVCSNTTVSKLVYDWIAGWEQELPTGDKRFVPGKLSIFSNEHNNRRRPYPNTILVDSEQLETGETMSVEFKEIASDEIEAFKSEYRARYPGRDVDQITDEDLMREVMNTVGKLGRLGERVKCVVSVSMLTEGWDTNTVTHILGVRAFGTQLLCEQVVGRALRRISYALDPEGRFSPEYADVLGVPFSLFIPTGKYDPKNPKPNPTFTHVRALDERRHFEIEFPHVTGYRYEIRPGPLVAKFGPTSRFILSTKELPTETENAPIVGESVILNLDSLKERRKAEVDFLLTKLVLEKYFRADGTVREDKSSKIQFEAGVQAWRFPEVLAIVQQWRKGGYLECKDDTFPQLLLMLEFAHTAADRIYQAIEQGQAEDKLLKPMLRDYQPVGSTAEVDFDTTRVTFATTKSHVSHVALDSGWEGKMAQKLEAMDEVICYVKNDQMGYTIPYSLGYKERNYVPDFIARINDGQAEPLNLIIEVSGEKRSDKDAKVAAACNFWVPAVNNHGGFGRWDFVEVTEPEDAKNTIRNHLRYRETRPMLVQLAQNEESA